MQCGAIDKNVELLPWAVFSLRDYSKGFILNFLQTCSLEHQIDFSGKHSATPYLIREDIKYPPLSVASYLSIELSELEQRRVTNLPKVRPGSISLDCGPCALQLPAAVSKRRQFRSHHICLCLSEDTLKAGGPFCLVSMPWEVKDPTQG